MHRAALTAVTPAAGHRGDRVTLSGAGLFSADGMMTLMFGSVQAPVSCPTQTMCTATVPAQPAPAATSGPVTVTLTTSAGTSRPVAFSYLN